MAITILMEITGKFMGEIYLEIFAIIKTSSSEHRSRLHNWASSLMIEYIVHNATLS